ncbi:hypothetical protein [Myxococcus vastator]|uniref:hypothetical protein n=1 Tax=Myxococcus vastator TaxID=2709664 RepID=UPI0013D65198|nr:hypothetical protein [Myxococcus vastator]
MPLEESIVFRQLDAGGRFSRFSYEDAIPVLSSYSLTYLIGHMGLGLSQGYALVALLSTALAMYFLRARFPDGLFGLIRYFAAPKHLSALTPDVILKPYPGRRDSNAARSSSH